jgi:hypothetical protein
MMNKEAKVVKIFLWSGAAGWIIGNEFLQIRG